MEPELDNLEEKIAQFVRLCQQLRAENIQLRQQLAVTTSHNRILMEKIGAAASRLEVLLSHIPESKE
jgi:uncharacterized protein (TIGR02449 family)